MSADKYFTVLNNPVTDVTSSSEKPTAEFWLRVYAKNKEGAAKLPYDQGLDTMPLLKGNSEFVKKNNKFLRTLYKQCLEHLAPGEESVALPLIVKVYRKSNDTASELPEEEEDEISFF
jgi:hypothetical protein